MKSNSTLLPAATAADLHAETVRKNLAAISYYLNVRDMETAIHGATPVSAKLRYAMRTEYNSPNPKSLAEILAPFKAELDAAVCNWS